MAARFKGRVLIAHVQPVRTLVGHTDEVKALALSADGLNLFSGGRDGVLRHWDVAANCTVRKPVRSV